MQLGNHLFTSFCSKLRAELGIKPLELGNGMAPADNTVSVSDNSQSGTPGVSEQTEHFIADFASAVHLRSVHWCYLILIILPKGQLKESTIGPVV